MKMRLMTSTLFVILLSIASFSQTKMNIDPTFAPVLNGGVRSVEILSDGKILIVGDFSVINGVTRKEIARLNADGSVDMSFDANWLAGGFGQGIQITTMKLLADGKILVAGDMPFDGSSGGRRVRRLNADGSPDASQTAFPSVGSTSSFSTINNVDQLPSGKILVCGAFDQAGGGNSRLNIARFNNNGTFDSTFATALNDDCNDVEIQPDGKYLVAGYFTTVNGNPTEMFVRFNTDDSVDTGFNAQPVPNTTSRTWYDAIKLESDGTIFAFRGYSVYGVMTRLNANGTIRTNYPGAIDTPGDAIFQSNGKTLILAEYMTDAGVDGRDLIRYNRDGSRDPSLNRMFFGGSSDAYPRGGGFTSDGKLIVGGYFTNIYDFRTNTTTNVGRLIRFTQESIPIKPKYDFDGDGKDDMAVFRPSDSVWHLNRSSAGYHSAVFGLSTDIPVVSDYDNDGKADIAVYRNGVWYWLRSSDSAFAYAICGVPGDIPVVAERTGYGTPDFLVFRPSNGKFYYQWPFSPNVHEADMRGLEPLGTDKPVVADFDGDGTDDLAVFRDGHWLFVPTSVFAARHYQFGTAGDKPVLGDFDGDLRTDFAVYRPSEGVWYINQTNEGFVAVRWGLAEDIPVPADYNGDGKTDIAVYRPSNGVWYQLRSDTSFHIEHFGLNGDIPAQVR